MNLFSSRMAVVDCVSGRKIEVEQTPFTIGSGEACDWRLDDQHVPAEHCVIQRKGSDYFVLPLNGTGVLQLDGVESAGGQLSRGEDHTLVVGDHFLALRSAGDARHWLEKVDHTEWFIFDPAEQQKAGPCAFHELSRHLARRPDGGSGAIVLCRGLTTMGFHAAQVLARFPAPPVAPPLITAAAPAEAIAIDVEYGEFTCPVCWLRFDRGDAMNIAVHASLRGDPILGEAHMQRFHATRLNDRGQAVDALAIPAPELACPHCRRKLPPGFLDAPHHIFSIVGAPSSGKTYYLSVLVKMLQTTLSQMKTHPFSAATLEPAEPGI